MATSTAQECFTPKEIYKVIGNLRAIRAASDLLCMAADTDQEGRAEFRRDTLADIGVHLEDLATEALELLRWEGEKPGKAGDK